MQSWLKQLCISEDNCKGSEHTWNDLFIVDVLDINNCDLVDTKINHTSFLQVRVVSVWLLDMKNISLHADSYGLRDQFEHHIRDN